MQDELSEGDQQDELGEDQSEDCQIVPKQDVYTFGGRRQDALQRT